MTGDFQRFKGQRALQRLDQLGIMVGLHGLRSVFLKEFPNAKVQRCQVHVAKNVLTKVPKNLKPQVANSLRDIFYASSRPKAIDAFDKFFTKYETQIPSAVKCLKNVIDECLTFYSFSDEE